MSQQNKTPCFATTPIQLLDKHFALVDAKTEFIFSTMVELSKLLGERSRQTQRVIMMYQNRKKVRLRQIEEAPRPSKVMPRVRYKIDWDGMEMRSLPPVAQSDAPTPRGKTDSMKRFQQWVRDDVINALISCQLDTRQIARNHSERMNIVLSTGPIVPAQKTMKYKREQEQKRKKANREKAKRTGLFLPTSVV